MIKNVTYGNLLANDNPLADLVKDLMNRLKMFHAINPKENTVRKVLEKIEVNNAWELGNHYGCKEVYKKFAQDYKNEIFK